MSTRVFLFSARETQNQPKSSVSPVKPLWYRVALRSTHHTDPVAKKSIQYSTANAVGSISGGLRIAVRNPEAYNAARGEATA